MVDEVGRWLRRRQGIERNPVYRLSIDVAEGRMTPEAAYQAVERSSLLNRLADGEMWQLDREAELLAADDPQRALLLIRLTILAARYKGFDRLLVDCNLRAADHLATMGNEREQELHLREALHAAERIANVPGKRRALSRLARLNFDRGETERARELLNRQLESGREDSDTLEDVETAILLGDLARTEDDPIGAQEYYQRAARSAKRVGHFAGVVDALLRQVVILRELGEPADALLVLQQAQEAADRTIDLRSQAEIAIQTGAILSEQHQYQQARTHLLTALERSRSMADIAVESRCLTGLARVEQRSGRTIDAAGHFEELADLELRLGNRSAAVQARLESANIFMSHGDPNRALATLQQVQPLADSLEDPAVHQQVLGSVGLVYGALGRRNDAVETLMAAVQQARRAGDVEMEARWLLGIGETLLQFGELDDALALAKHSLEIAEQHGRERLQAQALGLIGSISLARGLYREAEENLVQALSIAHRQSSAADQLSYLQLLAQIGQKSGQPQFAIRYLRQALDVATLYSGAEARIRLHGQLARLHSSLNQLPEAEDHYLSAVSAAEEAEQPGLAGRALRGLASTQDAMGSTVQALETYTRALDIADQTGDLRSVATLRYNIGAILYENNEVEGARQQLNRALEAAMTVSDYDTADAARELLRWLSPATTNDDRGWSEDLLLTEFAVDNDAHRWRDSTRP
ncbi:MAG TPA: tetratricopeptide repeat protein [Nitrolancea sp.]|nr:tetratricopeptide repeat protein [Nitrolancea sp.]